MRDTCSRWLVYYRKLMLPHTDTLHTGWLGLIGMIRGQGVGAVNQGKQLPLVLATELTRLVLCIQTNRLQEVFLKVECYWLLTGRCTSYLGSPCLWHLDKNALASEQARKLIFLSWEHSPHHSAWIDRICYDSKTSSMETIVKPWREAAQEGWGKPFLFVVLGIALLWTKML